jgi:hypothetical protein
MGSVFGGVLGGVENHANVDLMPSLQHVGKPSLISALEFLLQRAKTGLYWI